MKAIGYTVTFLITMAIGLTYSGFALSVLWGWFVSPTFGAPELTVPAAIGLATIVSYLTRNWTDGKDEEKEFSEKMVLAWVAIITKPSMALLIGWVVTFFM